MHKFNIPHPVIFVLMYLASEIKYFYVTETKYWVWKSQLKEFSAAV